MEIGDKRRGDLVAALCAAFEMRALREIVADVDRSLVDHVVWDGAKHAAVTSALHAAAQRGAAVVEAIARAARRARREHDVLARAVRSCWPYARGVEPGSVDDLVAALVSDAVAAAELAPLAARFAPGLAAHGTAGNPEVLADIVERLAGHAAAPGEPLPLFRVAAELQRPERPAVTAWLSRVVAAHSSTAAIGDGRAPVPVGSSRMLIALYAEDNDDYTGEIYFADAVGRPQLVAYLPRAALAEIPTRIRDEVMARKALFEAIRTSRIHQIDIVLPLKDVLAAVDEWTLIDDELSIGVNYRVVVRCLERNWATRWIKYVLARPRADERWKEMCGRELDTSCEPGGAVHWIERPEQLTPSEVLDALTRHAGREWLVAALCADAPAAERQAAIARMMLAGVPAAIAVRGCPAEPPRRILEPVCAQPATWPDGVHKHRTGKTRLPVTLLWDDPYFRPEEWQ